MCLCACLCSLARSPYVHGGCCCWVSQVHIPLSELPTRELPEGAERAPTTPRNNDSSSSTTGGFQPGSILSAAAAPSTTDVAMLVCVDCERGRFDHDINPATDCLDCIKGSFAGAGAIGCALCQPGMADTDSDPATPCVHCLSDNDSCYGEAHCLCPFLHWLVMVLSG